MRKGEERVYILFRPTNDVSAIKIDYSVPSFFGYDNTHTLT